MLKPITTLLFLFIVFSTQRNFSQEVKFGKVSKTELEEKFYPLDSSTNAAILYKKRRTYFNYVQDKGWELTTVVHERIKIYNKEGYDWATKQIRLYQGNHGEEKVSIKANTFNLVNGKVEKTKLKSNQIFLEEVNKFWKFKKFTMPNLTEGSVIEWTYTFRSEYYTNIDDMVFQYKIPLKYIDTKVTIPEYFVYKYLPSYFYPIKINESSKSRTINLTFKSREGIVTVKTKFQSQKVDLTEKIYSSIEKNIPALKDEPFTNNINNYRSKTSFELTAYKPKNGIPKYFNNNWNDVTKTIYKNSNFGGQLEKKSYFQDELQNLVSTTAPTSEKIAKIFHFVKNKMKWDGFYSKYTSIGVRKAYKENVGNNAEINLILVAMLRGVGLNANPILVSTRDHGIPIFPTTDGFNYVIAGVEIDKSVILLDATEKYSLPNVLPLRTLNWKGRIVRKNGSSNSISLFPKKHSKNVCFLKAEIDDEGILKGGERNSFNNLLALQKRSINNNSSESDLVSKFENDYDNIEIDEFETKNKKDLSKSLFYQYKFEADNQIEVIGDKMYFSPLLFHTEKENPFKLEERKFPVDFGVPWEDKITVSIMLPKSYQIESLPENTAFSLPENLGSFKFMTVVNGNKLQVVCSTKINLSIISPLYYESLKEFYRMLVDKQLEKVVLVKK